MVPFVTSHYCDVIMSAMVSQSTGVFDGVSIVCPTVCSGADQWKYQARVTGRWRWAPGGFPSQRASNAENVSIWWRHHVFRFFKNETYFELSAPSTLYPTFHLMTSFWNFINRDVLWYDIANSVVSMAEVDVDYWRTLIEHAVLRSSKYTTPSIYRGQILSSTLN